MNIIEVMSHRYSSLNPLQTNTSTKNRIQLEHSSSGGIINRTTHSNAIDQTTTGGLLTSNTKSGLCDTNTCKTKGMKYMNILALYDL